MAINGKRIRGSKRPKFKGRSDHTFLALRHDVLRSTEFGKLGGNAVKLLLFLSAQFNGKNNGDLSMSKKDLLAAGWASEETARRARDELLAAGFIRITRNGLSRRPHLYGVTFKPIDECPGKGLEVAAEHKACDWWKRDATLKTSARNNTPKT